MSRVCLFLIVLLIGSASVRAGQDVRLHSDGALQAAGEEFVLAGVAFPPLQGPLAVPDRVRAAMVREIVRTLDAPHESSRVGRDRYGREIVLLRARNGELLQERLLAAGLAYAFPEALDEADAAALWGAETAARAARRGVWGTARWGLQRALEVTADPVRAAVVRGVVRRVLKRSPWVYIDFGEDWRSDFTARVSTREGPRWRRAGSDVEELVGTEVEVRGWISYSYGPMMELDEPFQLEIVE